MPAPTASDRSTPAAARPVVAASKPDPPKPHVETRGNNNTAPVDDQTKQQVSALASQVEELATVVDKLRKTMQVLTSDLDDEVRTSSMSLQQCANRGLACL